jgi:arylsulfatase B/arylsulfatase I/J
MYGRDPNPQQWNQTDGANRMITPNLDKLSGEGVRLENYYIQPVCSPTRATLLTGRYVFHHGVHVPFIDSSRSTLPLNETTLAERLRSANYATHAVGKWRKSPD